MAADALGSIPTLDVVRAPELLSLEVEVSLVGPGVRCAWSATVESESLPMGEELERACPGVTSSLPYGTGLRVMAEGQVASGPVLASQSAVWCSSDAGGAWVLPTTMNPHRACDTDAALTIEVE